LNSKTFSQPKPFTISCSAAKFPTDSHGCHWSLFHHPYHFLANLPPQATVSIFKIELKKNPEHSPTLFHVRGPGFSDGGGEAEREVEWLEGIFGASERVYRSRLWAAAVVFAVRVWFAVG
jgi:hypothetical protein